MRRGIFNPTALRQMGHVLGDHGANEASVLSQSGCDVESVSLHTLF